MVKKGFVVAVLILISIVLIGSQILKPRTTNSKRIIVSPVPKTIAAVKSIFSPVLGEKAPWIPDITNVIKQKIPPPEITGLSALSVDTTTNQILFEKNSKERRPPASTIKIMTALIALENSNLDKEIVISEQAARVGEDSMGLTKGERYSLRELLYGLMLVSGNDASEAIAEGIAGRRELFISMMNAKAASLGLKDTKFVNPSGLDGDGEHYSTAEDLIILTKYTIDKFPVFKEIVATKEYIIPQTDNHKQIFLDNETNLLRTYPGVMGVKTGYTPAAGLNLVTLAKNDGQEILAVVLGSSDRRGDMIEILDYSFSGLGILIKH